MAKVLDVVQTVIAWALRLRIVRAALMYSDQRGGLLAAAVTFRALFAVFAAVLLGFSLASAWLSSRGDLWDALIEMVDSVIPGLIGTGDSALIKIDQLGTGLGAVGTASVLALIWALVTAVGNLRMSVRTIAGRGHDTGSAPLVYVTDLVFALSIGVLLAASAAVSFVGSSFVDSLLGWLGWTSGALASILTWLVTVVVTFMLDTIIIVWMFKLLSGVTATFRQILPGALIGGAGLVVLQQASSLFVGGASNNPLLATFASLIALLLWFNLSAQVILIACAFIVTTVEEDQNRVGARFGAETMKQRAVRAAERDLLVSEEALRSARADEIEERQKAEEKDRAAD